MRKALLALVGARHSPPRWLDGTASPGCCQRSPAARAGQLNLVKSGLADDRHGQPGLPALVRRRTEEAKWKVNDPSSGQGLRVRGRLCGRGAARLPRSHVKWRGRRPVREVVSRPGKKTFDFDIDQVSYTPERAKAVTFSNSYYDVNQAIVGLQGDADRERDDDRRPEGVQARRADRDDELRVHRQRRSSPTRKPPVYDTERPAVQALKTGRSTGSSSTCRRRSTSPPCRSRTAKIVGPVRRRPEQGALRARPRRRATRCVTCVNKAIAALKANGTLKRLQQHLARQATGAPVLK